MGKIWFITGTSKGLGLAIAKAALEDGASVVATARKPETLNHLVETYGSERVLPLALDVTKHDQVDSCVKAAVEKFGRLDVVVNNAGYADIASVEDTSIESMHAQLAANLFGVIYVTKAAIPIMRKQKSGHILQVSSIGGRACSPGLGAYQAAKWAVGGFSGVTAAEVAPFGIKVTTLEPGGMKTDWGTDEVLITEGYEETVGWLQSRVRDYRDMWDEPQRMADTIVKLTGEADPPVRLLLGPMTLRIAKEVAQKQADSDEKWQKATMLQL